MNNNFNKSNSFWSKFNTLFGCINNTIVTPIIYSAFLVSLILYFTNNGGNKTSFGVVAFIFFCTIIYDFISKMRPSDDSNDNFSKLFNRYVSLSYSFVLICMGFAIYHISRIVFTTSDPMSKYTILPFLVAIVLIFLYVFAKAINRNMFEKIFLKLYLTIFLIIWFGLTIFWTIGIVKQEGTFVYAIIAIPFYAVGIYIFKKYIIDK